MFEGIPLVFRGNILRRLRGIHSWTSGKKKNTYDNGAVETTSQTQELHQVKQCRQKQARTLLPVSSFQQKKMDERRKRIKKTGRTKQDIATRKNEEL